MENKVLTRGEVNPAHTWDLTAIYADEAALQRDLDKLTALTAEIEQYKGRLTDADAILACLDLYRRYAETEVLAANYADLAASVDFTDSALQEQNTRVQTTITGLRSRLSFVESEILQQDETVIHAAMNQQGPCTPLLEDMLRRKAYQLDPEAERVLAAYGSILNLPYEAYCACKYADTQFDPFTVDGKEYPLGYSLFEDDYEYDERTPVRREAFRRFSETIAKYQNTTAAVYNAQCTKEKIDANLRGYSSVFDALLFPQKVTREMYDRQIDTIMEKLAPHMRRYAGLLKKIYKLDEMTYADLKLPVDPAFDPKVSIEESRAYIRDGLSIMGEEYTAMVDDAYRQRWVDFAKNVGKSTGGFCASPYGNHSYILLNWNNRMSDVMTLAHELGHAGHFKACNASQSIFGTDVSTYFVEAPSTINELLMAHHLLKTNPDKRFRRWVLSCMIGNTYYHNFVTHLLEAAYQREVYRIIDNGGSVQADTLSAIMKDVLQRFWGDSVVLCDGAELTWMRQPHYYMGLYSYTYSAGLTIGTQVCKRIEQEGAPAVEAWKQVLRTGGTKSPVELAAMAGVDITTDAPLLDTIDTIGSMIDEIIALTEELEKE
ncbi:MAG: oligoendopeptidase F [Clostridia bacterium]|nr:oligoendopeptidase F [Clostridia bacterium]